MKNLKFYAIGAGVLFVTYQYWRLKKTLESVTPAKLWEALTFSVEDLGPAVELTEQAALSQQDYIDRGYLEVLPGGGTRITPAGEAYIAEQLAKGN